ncbi:MAG: CAP domain-containing protein, partial [Acidobacteria bacterium]
MKASACREAPYSRPDAGPEQALLRWFSAFYRFRRGVHSIRPACSFSWTLGFSGRMRTALAAAITVGLLIAFASCSLDRSRPATFAPVTGGFEQQTFAGVNRYRVSKGLRPLVWSDVIADQARRHSQNMARGRTRYGHGGFKQRLEAIAKRIHWSRAAENVVANPTAAGAVDRWLKSG